MVYSSFFSLSGSFTCSSSVHLNNVERRNMWVSQLDISWHKNQQEKYLYISLSIMDSPWFLLAFPTGHGGNKRNLSDKDDQTMARNSSPIIVVTSILKFSSSPNHHLSVNLGFHNDGFLGVCYLNNSVGGYCSLHHIPIFLAWWFNILMY